MTSKWTEPQSQMVNKIWKAVPCTTLRFSRRWLQYRHGVTYRKTVLFHFKVTYSGILLEKMRKTTKNAVDLYFFPSAFLFSFYFFSYSLLCFCLFFLCFYRLFHIFFPSFFRSSVLPLVPFSFSSGGHVSIFISSLLIPFHIYSFLFSRSMDEVSRRNRNHSSHLCARCLSEHRDCIHISRDFTTVQNSEYNRGKK
jgi:hypothetical protein